MGALRRGRRRAERPDLSALEGRIGHAFDDKDLLARALTHVSAGAGEESYQRLEFLGDRVLGLAVAEGLLRALPGADEGDLSRRLSGLVRRESCAAVAQAWEVGPHLRLGAGEVHGGGRRNPAILADVCEAILGAIFLDAGYAAAKAVIDRAFAAAEEAEGPRGRDPKSALQEWAQGLGLPTPTYAVVERAGPDHAPIFRIEARVAGVAPSLGVGGSKRLAEQEAARLLLRREGVWREEGTPATE
ncbi:Ribonuclease III [Methylobacterium sp. 4-46]|uniref:ribonuclease III n=1 Tax=unclassified Methylobacterium TaxID=2615210 RepID=UPI000152DA84|nr:MULTISPECIES: ribonuclease III [Methylobacterium]ACA20868.1 Ribonuclease III [Methylobacterium sp. 4-46]WFT80024.1 ribonuclease III [Methylobacterium nodulans]